MVSPGERSKQLSPFSNHLLSFTSKYLKSSDQKLFKVMGNSGEYLYNKDGKKKEKKEKKK